MSSEKRSFLLFVSRYDATNSCDSIRQRKRVMLQMSSGGERVKWGLPEGARG